MSKSRGILEQKANESAPLRETIDNQGDEVKEQNNLKPTTIINEEGKKVIVFQDPLYSREKRSVINYTIFKGKWEFENIDEPDDTDKEKCAIKFTPVSDGSEITLAFKSLKDRVEFMDSIYSDTEMKQIGTGIQLEDLANSKVLKTTGGLIGLSLAGYGLYKLFGKKSDS